MAPISDCLEVIRMAIALVQSGLGVEAAWLKSILVALRFNN